MAKNNIHNEIRDMLSDTDYGEVSVNGRTINVFDDKILNKPAYYKRSKQKGSSEPLKIQIKLDEKTAKLPTNYMMSNIPVYAEDKYMQQYHFIFNNEQLKEMFTTPKIIVDRWHSTFVTSEGVVHRTSFFAVAPHADTKNGIPMIYRFSITRQPNIPDHYTINVHAIVGGKEDGWLFLARLDNSDSNATIHPILQHYLTKQFLKRHNAVRTQEFNFHQEKRHQKLKGSNDINKYCYCIPYPHMHQATPYYEVGDQAERVCPKFLRKCANNDFAQNLAYMLKAFRVYDRPHFRSENDNLYSVIREEKRITTINDNPNPQYILAEILEQEKQRAVIKPLKKPTKIKHERPVTYRARKNKNINRHL